MSTKSIATCAIALFLTVVFNFTFTAQKVSASDNASQCQAPASLNGVLLAQAEDAQVTEEETDVEEVNEEEQPQTRNLKHVLEEQQHFHDKILMDRFLLGIAVMFAIIAFMLFISNPPRPREQKS